MQQAESEEKEKPGTRPLFELAAQSIVAVSGMAETVVDLLHGRALKHYSEGLRQYLAVRLANPERAVELLRELRALVAAQGADDLVKPPGIRARIYGLARELSESRGAREVDPANRALLPYRTPSGADAQYKAALDRLRSELPPDEAEALELRHARGLNPEELAHVLGLPPQMVDKRLDAGLLKVRSMLGERTQTLDMAQVVLDAFALEARDETIELDIDDGVAALPEDTIIGERYKVEARVGSGSFSDVYRASDTEVPGHEVAVKLLHQPSLSDKAKDEALRELHLIASVFHPSVVQFKDHGWYEGRLWFVMPWYLGETLEARIQREPLSRAEAKVIFQNLARALAAMHASGIRHQDVKPDNIFLAKLEGFGLDDQGGVLPVLLDLGVAAKEAEMVVAGTPTYFAPEVAAQFANVPIKHMITTKADIFSLVLSLRNSLEPESQDDVAGGAVETFIEHRAQYGPDLPLGTDLKFLKPHLSRWMSNDPADRPSAEELVMELEVLTRPEDRRRRIAGIMKWLGPLLLAIAVGFGSVVYILQQQKELQALATQQARDEADSALADLTEESERARDLEADVARERERYQSTKLSREELGSELGETKGQLLRARAQIDTEQRRTRAFRDRFVDEQQTSQRLSGELDTTRGTLTQTQGQLASERSRADELDREATRLRQELASATSAADAAQGRVTDLTGQLAALQSQLASQQARADTLDRRISEAEAAKARAEAELATAQRRIRQLERQLARSGGTGTGQPTPPNPDPPGGPPSGMVVPQ